VTEDMRCEREVFGAGGLLSAAMILLGVVAAGMILKYASSVLIPFTVAFFLMLLLQPLADRAAGMAWRTLRRMKNPLGAGRLYADESKLSEIFSVIIVLLLFVMFFFGFYALIRGQLELILSKSDEIMENIVEPVKSWMVSCGLFGDADSVSEYMNGLAESAVGVVPNAAKPIISGVFTFIMILVLTVFLMVGRKRLEENLRNNLEPKKFEKVLEISGKVESNTRKFLLTKLIASSITGLTIGLGLLLFLEPQDAVTWGFISFVMNFIPIYGSLIAGTGAVLYTMALYENGSFLDAWPVILLVLTVNMMVSNVLEPKLMQFSLPLGPVTVLLAVIAWAWLWGAWGMILAVPITIFFKVMIEEVSGKGWLSALMET